MADTKTTAETLRSVLDGTELIRLATPGANWKTPAVGVLGARIRLTTVTTFFVATTGSDSNDGLTALTPWLTIQHAVDTIVNNYYIAIEDTISVAEVILQIADGTYTTVQGVILPPFGGLGFPNFIIQGNQVTPANVVINTSGAAAVFYAWGSCEYILTGMKIDASTDAGAAVDLLVTQRGSGHLHVENCILGKAGNAGGGNHAAIYADAGAPSIFMQYIQIAGTAQSFMRADGEHNQFASIRFLHGNLDLLVDPLWPQGCINLSRNATCVFNYDSTSGTSSGPKGKIAAGCMLVNTASIPGTGFTNDGIIINTTGSGLTGQGLVMADAPNNNFHFAGAGNLTMTGAFNYTLGANAGLALTSGANNYVFGRDAGKAMTSGASNVLIGRAAGTALTTSLQNVAIGQNSLSAATTLATQSVAIGFDAMQSAIGGQHNVGIGPGALNSISGSDNVGLGYQALASALSGGNNLGMGASALLACTTGNANCAVGASALAAITTGNNNTGIGTQALGVSALGDSNIAIGFQSLFFAGTVTGNIGIGYQAGSHQLTGDYNIYIGYQSGQSGTTSSGSFGVGVGWQSLYSVTSGTSNCVVGAASGNQITTGDRNVIFGSNNCYTTLTTGSRNIIVGDQIEVASNSASNTLNIGNYIFGTGMDGLGTTISAGKIGIGIKAPAFNLDVAGSLGQKEAAFLMHTSIALTAGSTANAPTLTAGPVTGNPTKWIALDDNGTTRYIPSW